MSRFKALAFVSLYLWKLENPDLEFHVQERVGEFEAWWLQYKFSSTYLKTLYPCNAKIH